MSWVNQKPWGWTECLHDSRQCELHRIDVKAGGYCSQHEHLHKWNAFQVVRGRLQVEVWTTRAGRGWSPSDPPDTVVLLGPGDCYSVAPGLVHRFTCDVPTSAFETYWPVNNTRQVSPDDIMRYSEGGIRK